jgi:flagellar FliJ protein
LNGFNFNLQKVLDVRNIEEDVAHNKFLKSRQEKKNMEEKLLEMNQTKDQIYNYLREKTEGSVEKTIQARQFLQLHQVKIDRQQKRLDSQKKEVEKKQKELVSRQKKRKVLEKLKEKEFKEFQTDFLQTEQKLLDAIGQRAQQDSIR